MKNKTSSVAIDTTVARIETALARAGARNIMKQYDRTIKSLVFQVAIHDRFYDFRLPVDVDAVYNAMAKKIVKPHQGTMERIRKQAARTAWKLMQDWVEVQLSLIEMEQAEVLQVFLPYMFNGKETFYALMKQQQFRLIEHKEKL